MFENYGVLVKKEVVKKEDGKMKLVRTFEQDWCVEHCEAEIAKLEQTIAAANAYDPAPTIEKAQAEIEIFTSALS